MCFLRKVRWYSINKKGLRINSAIRADIVRLIDESNNQVGIVERYVAINKARETGLDLVEVAPTSDPPVCRIMDYGKWRYEEKRKQREGRKKSQLHSTTMKEIRLRPETDKHDLEVKLKKARQFLEKGHKVQFTMFFRGRQVLHQDLGYKIFNEITVSLEELAKVDNPARMANKRMTLLLVPKS
ncbi:MAG: translation initiation factor IF-3 [Planctomycetota bacterium]